MPFWSPTVLYIDEIMSKQGFPLWTYEAELNTAHTIQLNTNIFVIHPNTAEISFTFVLKGTLGHTVHT